MTSELTILQSRAGAFLSRARGALASGPPASAAVFSDLVVDGYAEVLVLETAGRRLRRRIDGLAYAGLDDLELLRELHAEAAAVASSLAEVRGALDQLAERLLPPTPRSR